MERKYLQNLIDWKDDPDKKPLLVLGARQVGKTYLIEELFAKKYFTDSYLRIDCSDDVDFVDYVNKNDNLKKVLDYIIVHYDFIPDPKHLLIFDEIQECLPLLKMMKHFCEKRRELPVIVSGSLVRTKLSRQSRTRGASNKKKVLFPVGKINQLMIYPLTFDEFLLNYKKPTYDYLLECFKNKKAIDDEMHEELMDIFDEYLFVGGMPEAVDTFIKYKKDKVLSYKKTVDKIDEIYSDYLSDMDLYQASPESVIRSRLIFKGIYSQLNKENKNFKPSKVEDNLKNRDLISPIGWLIMANVVNKCNLVKERVTTPLIEDEESLYRLYLSDMGLFTFQSGLNAKTFILNKENALSGIFYENYISTELVARKRELFYWKGKRNGELEFLLDISGRVIPLDVKKSKGLLNSVDEFRQHNKKDTIIKVSKNKYGYNKEKDILTLPFYYFSFFLNELDETQELVLD